MKLFNSLVSRLLRWLCLAAVTTTASCGGDTFDKKVSPIKTTSGAESLTKSGLALNTPNDDGFDITGEMSCVASSWQAERFYATGTVVYHPHSGERYVATIENQGQKPESASSYWTRSVCDQVRTLSTVVRGVQYMVSERQFNLMFPKRSRFYTYASFIAASKHYPGLFRNPSPTVRRREAAAFFANVKHETGGLVFIREANRSNWARYCATHKVYPCHQGRQYFGRGPIQISWNYNYGAAGKALGVKLLHDPDIVTRDAVVAWRTAMWFWMTQQGAGTMTPHHAMTSATGFGETVRSINGVLECRQPNGTVGKQQMYQRLRYYREFSRLLGVSTGSNLTC